MKSTVPAKLKSQVDARVSDRGLSSVMNNTKWAELQNAVNQELPFAPPYQIKAVLNDHPEPKHFEADANYFGAWNEESLSPFYGLEWIRIRPRVLRRRGRLIPPEVQSVESQLLEILQRYNIPIRTMAIRSGFTATAPQRIHLRIEPPHK